MEVFFTDCNITLLPKCDKQPRHSKQVGTVFSVYMCRYQSDNLNLNIVKPTLIPPTPAEQDGVCDLCVCDLSSLEAPVVAHLTPSVISVS